MTPCIEGPTKPIKGADHNKPVTHWQMAPGTALRLTSDGREEVKITPEMAKRAVHTFCMYHGGLAEFRIGDQLYAQPTAAPPPKKRGRSPAPKVERSSPHTATPVVGETGRSERSEPRRSAAKARKPIALEW